MTGDREQRARDLHREADDGSEWAMLTEEQRELYRQSADRLYLQRSYASLSPASVNHWEALAEAALALLSDEDEE